MTQQTPIVLISPEARAALVDEVEQSSASGETSGGLLFGYPVDKRQRLLVSSVRLSADVGFGRRAFSLDQTRTSRQLEAAQSLDPQATYCGVWYLHRTPNRELTDAEWVQTQTLLEDPDFRFNDLVCLVLCFYSAELNIYASSFNRHHSSRGQAPDPTELRLTTDWLEPPRTRTPLSSPPSRSNWYQTPDVASRLNLEHQRLAGKYRVEPALAPDGQMFLRLSPKQQYERMSFYLALGNGYPDKAPHAFLLIGGKPYRISSPSMGSWSASQWLVELADELMSWLVFSLNEYLTAAASALNGGSDREAADLFRLVLAIEPRTPKAARLLARAESAL
jgi:hypothetical protein